MGHTKRKDEARRLGRGLSAVLPALLGAGLAFGMVFVLLLAVASLVWSGTLTSANLPAALCAGVAALVGGRFAIGTGEGEPLPTGLLTAVFLCAGLLGLCLLYGGTVTLSRPLLSALLLSLAGGSFAGLLGRRKGRKRPVKR